MDDQTQANADLRAELAALRARVAELEALEAERGRAERVQAALYRIADAASAATDMDEFYAAIHSIVGELMYADYFYIALYDEARQMINYPFYRDTIDSESWPAPQVWLPMGAEWARGTTAYVLRTGQPALITPEVSAALIRQGEIEQQGVPSVDWLGVPLKNEGQTLGAVVVQSYSEAIRYTQQDKELLTFVAQHIATALSRARAIEETRQRNAELAIINSVQQGLAARLDMQAIFDLAGDKIHAIFDAQVVDLALYDRGTDLLRDAYTIERGVRLPQWEPYSPFGFRRYVVETRQPLVINEDYAHACEIYDNPLAIQGEVPKSAVFVPLIVDDQAKGHISLQNLDREHAFSEADVRLLNTLACSLSVALENARLFAETRRLLAETEQRSAELAIINSVGEAMTKELDVKTVTRLVGDKVRDIFKAETTEILLLDPQTNLIHMIYSYDRGYREDDEPFPLGQGLTSQVILTRQPLVISSYQDQSASGAIIRPNAAGDQEVTESYLGVPIIVGEKVLGAVDVQSYKQHAYNDNSVRLLATLSANMGVAIENARLFQETSRLLAESRQRMAELATVNTVSQALATELNLDALIELVGEQMRQTFAADIVYVALFDRETNLIRFPYVFGEEQGTIRFGEGLTSKILETGQPLLVNEDIEGRMVELGATLVGLETQSYLGVPILAGGQAIGVVSVQSTTQAGRFGQADLNLLSTIAANVGAAIQNAQLYAKTQRHAREMAALAEVGREISATLDLTTVLERIAAHAQELLHGRDVVLRLLEPDGRLPAVVALGKYTEIYRAWPAELGYGLTGHIAQTGMAEIVNDPQNDPRMASIPGTEGDDPTEAMIFAPLLARENVIGVMTVWRDKTVSGPFAQSDLDFMVGLARQAAIAIENARLFAEIQRQKEFSEALIEVSPVAIILCDLDEHVTGWNPAAETLFGYTRAEAVGRHLDDLVANRPDIRQDADRYTKATSQIKTHHGIGRRTRKDGQLVDVEFFGVPVSVDGQEVGAFDIYHDITELQRARQEAVAANEAKSAFLANMSHELRTPLNAIIGFTRIVRRKAAGALPDKQLDNLDKVLASGEHLLGLINTVLDIAKIEAGRMDVQPSNFNAAALVEGCATTAQPLLRPGVSLHKDIAADLPPIYSDQDKVKQILLNLLSNAAKFTNQGSITLRVRLETRDLRLEESHRTSLKPQASSLILFEVTDTGIGIAPDALERIFEEFQQADTSTTRQYGGTGLGLSISRHLAHLLGGDLVASSTPGQGSTFTLMLPMHYGEQQMPAQPTRPDTAPMAHTAEKPLVLAIDDDADAIEILQDNLADAGYQVVGARGGDEGVQKAKELKPYAITLDIMMPNKDGWQVLHELKSDPATRDIPVILLTIVDKKALGYQLGASDYLVKPLDREALLAALGRMAQANGGIAPKRLLVVDDDRNVIEMVQQLLGETPYEVQAATDGLMALDAIARRRPDVILLDLMMPGLDGFGVIEQLRQNQAYVSIPIIVLTAKTLTPEEAARLKESVVQVMQKQGLEGDTLIRELQRALHPATASQP